MPDGFASPRRTPEGQLDSAFDADTAAAALAGLGQDRKTLPARLFYDAAGCRLFGEITRLPEYYPTRTECALLVEAAPELGETVPPGAVLLEYGGSEESKACLLLAHLREPAGYVPIDVAEDALGQIVARMAISHPGLPVEPICADFQVPLTLPHLAKSHPRFGFFPGSTIGNLDRAAATRFLELARATLGSGAFFLVGVDLRKDPRVLIPAYADASGVTAAFNRNILTRLNREAAADFDPEQFEHRAVWNDSQSRIEMHLVSPVAQTRQVAGRAVRFAAGESIHTENSYKHSPESFAALVRSAGWQPARMWTDPAGLFSLHLLRSETAAW